MNLFAKTGPWAVAAVLAASSFFGQNSKCAPSQKSFDQGHDMMQSQMMAGYNASSRTEVRGSWDVYATGAFTYWQPIQENMELGVVANQAGTALPGLEANVVNANVDYKPGFQVALGMNFDHDQWDSAIAYTWFRGTTTTTTSLDAATAPETVLFPARNAPTSATAGYYNGTQQWKLHMDILDWDLARAYYVGTKLSFRPFFGARGLWIRQNTSTVYSSPATGNTITVDDVSVTSHSWAVGPRTGIATNWMIGEGFRLFGNGAGDILFTQYTRINNRETQGAVPVNYTQTNLNTIRTHLDLEFGIAWGSYFDNNNWHVDLSAGYGFQVFFNQNLSRQLVGTATTNVAHAIVPNGNLYMHGLTASARFDF